MTLIVATDRDGQVHELQADPEGTLMEVLRDQGLGVEAVCGGCCSCATCHVLVAEPWRASVGPAGDTESELLQISEFYDPAASRLSCQITTGPALEGLCVTVAPEE